MVLAREGRAPASPLAGHTDFGVVELDVALLKELGLTVRPDPVAAEPDHVVVEGRKTDSVIKRMAKAARWRIRPPAAYPLLVVTGGLTAVGYNCWDGRVAGF